MKTDRDALEAIRDYPLTNIADGDMLDALEAIQAIAAGQLEGDPWDDWREKCGVTECDSTDEVESTYCGSFCDEHLRAHLDDCEVCAKDWSKP